MPNQFSTVKNNIASSKFMLIRMTLRTRWRNTTLDTKFTLVSANLYKLEIDHCFAMSQLVEITNVRNSFVEVTTTPNANLEFQRFQGYVLFYVSTGAPSVNWIVFSDSYIFLTGESYKYAKEDPKALTGDIVEWKPLIKKYPSVEYNLENIFTGQLSIQASSFDIINNENQFNEYLGYYNSFYNKEIKIWLCIDSVDNCAGIFAGICTNFTVGEYITIGVEDNISALGTLAKFNDDRKYTYHNLEDNSALYPSDNGMPIPIFYGCITAYNLIDDTSGTGLANAKKIDYESLPKAICINYSTTISTSTNREWAIGRVSDYILDDLDGGIAIENVDNTDPNYTKFSIDTSYLFFNKSPFPKQIISALTIGDTVTINAAYYVRILKVAEVGGDTYFYTTKNGSISNTHMMTSTGVGSIIITDGTNEYICMDGRDYTVTATVTPANFNYITITFVNNFEASHGALTTLDPNKHKVLFRIRPSTSAGRAYVDRVTEMMLNSAGIETNTTSFTSFNTDKPIQLLMAIPGYDESEYATYASYIQKMLQGAGAFLYLDADLKIGIKGIGAGASKYTITENDILVNSFKINIDYRDMTTQAIIYNPTISADDTRVKGYDSGTVELLKNSVLHDSENTDRFIIVTDDYREFSFPRGKKTKYTFDLPSEYFDLLIGDRLTLNINNLLGNVTTVDVYISGIEKNVGSLKITATDLEFYNE